MVFCLTNDAMLWSGQLGKADFSGIDAWVYTSGTIVLWVYFLFIEVRQILEKMGNENGFFGKCSGFLKHIRKFWEVRRAEHLQPFIFTSYSDVSYTFVIFRRLSKRV